MGVRHQNPRRLFAYVALAALAIQLLLPEETPLAPEAHDAEPVLLFAPVAVQGPPTLPAIATEQTSGHSFTHGRTGAPRTEQPRTAQRAAPVAGVATLSSKVLHAMGAGAVASVIQAALSAAFEPIVNRVLVKRMKVMDAVRDVSPSMMLRFFKTTLITNFLKFPFFEAINAVCAHLPISPSIRGFVTGLVFTTATLPVTNYRYRKSMQLEVNWGNLYEAYLPTVIRDIFYGIVRNWSTIVVLAANPTWKATSPQVLFIVVILGCLGSAPFNEWRGYLLQSKGQELTVKEFFKPKNFIRSTTLGALKQGLALAAGYWAAPPASRFVNELMQSLKGH